MTLLVPTIRHALEAQATEIVDARPEGRGLPEEVLWRAYETPFVSVDVPAPQRCLCGSWIAPATEGAIPAVVRAHNDTPQHVAWARTAGRRR